MQSAVALQTPRQRFPWIVYAVVLLLILCVTLAPLISVVIASAIAEAHGCTLNEGGAHPCVINGVDYGETLVTMFVLGWLMLVTIPGGAIACLIWGVILAAHFIAWRRRGREARISAQA